MQNSLQVSQQPHVLVLDDEPLICELLSEALSECGLDTVVLGSADEGYRYLQSHAGFVSLVVTDVRMPGQMDGWELCSKVRALWPDLPIMVTSGYCNQSTQPTFSHSVFLRKPWSIPQVIEAATRLLADA